MKGRKYYSITILTLIMCIILGSVNPHISKADSFTSPVQNGNSSVVQNVYGNEHAATGQKAYLIKLKKNVDTTKFRNKQGIAKRAYKKTNFTNILISDLADSEVQSMKNDTDVLYIEPDSPVKITATSATYDSTQQIPWGIQSIGADLVSDSMTKGQNIKIAELDTGISQHPDLTIAGGESFVDGENTYSDDNGHGTEVAGVIAAQDNQLGIVGVAPQAEIYAVKVLNSNGVGSYGQIIQGIEWAIDNKMDIISLSLGGTEYSKALQEAVQEATKRGILVIAAAGNRGSGIETELYPALYPEVISVGSVGKNLQRSSFSSTGEALDIMAPGEGILSTTNNGGYQIESGTSMAVPHITGSAALLLSANRGFSREQIMKSLYDTATPLGDSHEYGHGLVNIARAFKIDENPPISLSPPIETSPLYIDHVDQSINNLSYNLLELQKIAEAQNNRALAKESLRRYNDLLISYTGLRQVPKKVTESVYGVSKASIENNYFESKQQAFVSLITEYQEIVNGLQTKMGTTIPPLSVKPTTPTVQKSVYASANAVSVISTPIYLDNPIDVDIPAGSSNVYSFTPTVIKDYRIFTGPYGGGDISGNYPKIEIFSDPGLINVVASCSYLDGGYSEIIQTLAPNVTYYIRLSSSNNSNIHTRLTVSYLPQAQTISLNAPINVDAPQFGYKVFSFTTSDPGDFQIYTSPFGDSLDDTNDTVLYVYTDAKMTQEIAYNDDRNTDYYDYFSEINLGLVSNKTFYIKLVGYGGQKVHARLTVTQSPNSFKTVQLDTPIDASMPSCTAGFYSFTPAASGTYRLFTGPYGGYDDENDTMIYLYSDSRLRDLLTFNDDLNTYFSDLSYNMTAGTTYYIVLRGYDTTSYHARFTVNQILPPDPPAIVLSNSNWTNQNITITITPGTGGVQSQYKLGAGGTWTNYTAPITISNEGQTVIYARTVNNAGTSTEVSATAKIDKTAPTVPSNLHVINKTDSTITLSWAASTDNVGITGYEIRIGTTLVGSVSKDTLQYTITGLSVGTVNRITISAKDYAGNSAESKVVKVPIGKLEYVYDPQGRLDYIKVLPTGVIYIDYTYDNNGNLKKSE